MTDPDLARLGWGRFFEEQIDAELAALNLARVVEEQRGGYRIAGGFDGWAEVSGRFRRDAETSGAFPVVGDWVGVRPQQGGDSSIIHRRLERRSTVSRKAAGRATDEQVIAANVDTLFLVTTFAADLSARRLERYLTLARQAGTTPVVVMNKSDLSSNPETEIENIRRSLPLVEVISVSALQSQGLDALDPYLQPASTVAMLGSSGVGKSTILNRLRQQDVARVAEVREYDDKGRHTTTSRQLIELPGGALLIDTPGMRELQPWADESSVDSAFDDIAALAADCRFSDCAHETEPGCAVLSAVASGDLTEDRLESYRHLLREAAFEQRKRDPEAAAELKRRWKKIHQANKQLYKDRERR